MSIDIVLVAAVAENGVIGRDGDMPWRLPSDLKHFKAVTMGRPVVMGRRTFESIGKPLPGRVNIVVTRRSDFAAGGVVAAGSLEDALAEGAARAKDAGVGEVMVIGGGQIYELALPRAARLIVTEVHARPEGDARFPDIDPTVWRETSRAGPRRAEKDSDPVSFVVYERR